MPKIATHEFSIDAKGMRKAYKVDVMYNQKDEFHVNVKNEDILTIIKSLSEDELKRQRIEKRARGYNWQNTYKEEYIICGDDVDDTKRKVQTIFQALLVTTVTTRDVIMIRVQRRATFSHDEYSYNTQHKPISISFGMAYATETTSGEGKTYRNKRNGYQIGNRTYDLKDWTIIDDTPEARETLEKLYTAANAVFDKLKAFTSPDKIGELLTTGGNFLPSPKD